MGALRSLASVSLLASLALGCGAIGTGVENAARSLNPAASYEVGVVEATPRGPYYVTRLRGDGLDLKFFVPMTDACRDLLESSGPLVYRRAGVFGELSEGDTRCDLAGTATLAAWRDRLGRVPGQPFPRGTARFEEIHRDEEVVLVRGRFPLLGRIRMPGGVDAVAMLPNDPQCLRPIERGQASLEFSDSARWAYRLVSDAGPCVVEGFAMPAEAG